MMLPSSEESRAGVPRILGGAASERDDFVPLMIPSWARASKEDPRRAWLRSEPFDEEPTLEHLTWDEICRRPECRGRWIALQGCRYDEQTGKAAEGQLVDVDDDLAALCGRIRDQRKNCAIVFVASTTN